MHVDVSGLKSHREALFLTRDWTVVEKVSSQDEVLWQQSRRKAAGHSTLTEMEEVREDKQGVMIDRSIWQ